MPILFFFLFVAVPIAIWTIRKRRILHRHPLNGSSTEKKWALITGASSGLGSEFARQLSARGFNCVLTARREKELQELKKELSSLHSDLEFKIVLADLVDPKGPEALLSQIKDQKIDLFVSNAGFGYQGRFDKQELSRALNVVNINCTSQVELTHRVVERMKENQGENKGGIIFVSSTSALQPLPYHSLYGAAKSFISSFGAALSEELRPVGIFVTLVEPGTIMDTNFQAESGQLSHHGTKSSEVVKDALSSHEEGKLFTTNKTFPWLRSVLGSLLPREVVLIFAKKHMAKFTPDYLQ